MTEEEARDSFAPLRLDVIHALWEAYHGTEHRSWPAPTQNRAGEEGEERKNALKEFPLRTVVWRAFTDARGRGKGHRAVVISNRPTGE